MTPEDKLYYIATLLNAKLYTWSELKNMNDKELKRRAGIILDTGYPDNIKIESLRNKPIT